MSRLRLPSVLAALLLAAAPASGVFEAAEVGHREEWSIPRSPEQILRALTACLERCARGCSEPGLEGLRIERVPREDRDGEFALWTELRKGPVQSWYSRATLRREVKEAVLTLRMLAGEPADRLAAAHGRPYGAVFDELETRFVLREEEGAAGPSTRVLFQSRAVLSGWNRGFEPLVRAGFEHAAAELRRIASGD